jgi:hypothetical protein
MQNNLKNQPSSIANSPLALFYKAHCYTYAIAQIKKHTVLSSGCVCTPIYIGLWGLSESPVLLDPLGFSPNSQCYFWPGPDQHDLPRRPLAELRYNLYSSYLVPNRLVQFHIEPTRFSLLPLLQAVQQARLWSGQNPNHKQQQLLVQLCGKP